MSDLDDVIIPGFLKTIIILLPYFGCEPDSTNGKTYKFVNMWCVIKNY